MKPYKFIILVRPEPESRFAKALAGGHAHCWVIAETIEAALSDARTYITTHNWIPQEVESAFEIQSEQIPDLDENDQRLYQRAVVCGIASDFHTWTHGPNTLPDGSYLRIPLPKK